LQYHAENNPIDPSIDESVLVKFTTPLLLPVEDGPRPFWTVLVPICNRLNYLERCLNSILDQDEGPDQMEIIVTDDSSDIDIESAVKQYGRGRVIYSRTASRFGLYGNTNHGLFYSHGQWIHVLHDDDFVLPGFYRTMRTAVEDKPEKVGVACCHYTNLHEDDGSTWTPQPYLPKAGILQNFVYNLAIQNPLNIPAVITRREVFEKIGLYSADLDYTGDWEFYIRSATYYDWWYQPEDLARFSVHPGSLTRTLASSGSTATNIRKTIERASTYLPPDVVATAQAESRRMHATKFLAMAKESFSNNNFNTGIRLATECAALSEEIACSDEFLALLSMNGAEPLRRIAAVALREAVNDDRF